MLSLKVLVVANHFEESTVSAHPACKFRPNEVRYIRRRFANGESARSLGREYEATGQSILNMVYGKTYTDCGGPISTPCYNKGERNPNAKLTADQIVIIRAKHRDGASIEALASENSIDQSVISKVCNNEAWIHISDLPTPKALAEAGAEALIAQIRLRFPGHAFITPAAFVEALQATDTWYSNQVQAGKLKAQYHMGVLKIRMIDAEAFLRAEYGTD